MIVKRRRIPKRARPISFRLRSDPLWGMVSLSKWNKRLYLEVLSHHDPHKIIVMRPFVKIHFPMFDSWYVQRCNAPTKDGFSLVQLMKCISNVGYKAGEYDTIQHPEHYNTTDIHPNDFLGEFAVVDSAKTHGIRIFGPNIYVTVQH